jgi:thiamine biosynthesis lipoprotein
MATSGTTKRFLLSGGARYGHILDPSTGRPVMDCPRSVTVAAASCVEAGMFATLGMLQGAGAETFLAAQGVRHWISR